jgi:hypothetical protein
VKRARFCLGPALCKGTEGKKASMKFLKIPLKQPQRMVFFFFTATGEDNFRLEKGKIPLIIRHPRRVWMGQLESSWRRPATCDGIGMGIGSEMVVVVVAMGFCCM